MGTQTLGFKGKIVRLIDINRFEVARFERLIVEDYDLFG